MDGREAFASGGPDKGELVRPDLVIASGDLIAIDVEAIKTLQVYEAKNKLSTDPRQSPQVTTALKHNLGVGRGRYILVE